MSSSRRKLKVTDVSAPIKVEHVSHVGKEDINIDDGNITLPPRPCTGTDRQVTTQTFAASSLTAELCQVLREIIREELVKAFEAERPKWFSEITSMQSLPTSSKLMQPGGDKTKEELEFLNIGGPTGTQMDGCWEVVNVDQNDQQIFSVLSNKTTTLDTTLRQFSDPLPIPRPRPTVAKECTSSSSGDKGTGSNTRNQSHKTPAPKPRAARRMSKDDERECLAQALQANITHLVDRLHLNHTNIPEWLISAGHVTEDECRMIRDDLSRKDQVRYLVSRMKGCDLNDMKMFLEILCTEIPDVVAMINDTFEKNKKNNVKCTRCALCLCSSYIDIKDVIDVLWGVRAIPDGFYNEIIACPKPRGSQKKQWKSLVEICNSKTNMDKKNVYSILFDAILSRGTYGFIVKPLRGMLDKEGRLDCHCHFSIRVTSLEVGSCGTMSSNSPLTSCGSILSATSETGFTENSLDRSTCKMECNCPDSGKVIFSKCKPRSLESVLDTVREENGKSSKTDLLYVNQTLEFHRPLSANDGFRNNAQEILNMHPVVRRM